MKFEKTINKILKEAKPKPHQCISYDVVIKDLNEYSKEFQKKFKALDKKLNTAKKWVYNRKGDKLGMLDDTFWKKYGWDLQDRIEEIFGEYGEGPPDKFLDDVKRFYDESEDEMNIYYPPSIGDFMC